MSKDNAERSERGTRVYMNVIFNLSSGLFLIFICSNRCEVGVEQGTIDGFKEDLTVETSKLVLLNAVAYLFPCLFHNFHNYHQYIDIKFSSFIKYIHYNRKLARLSLNYDLNKEI